MSIEDENYKNVRKWEFINYIEIFIDACTYPITRGHDV